MNAEENVLWKERKGLNVGFKEELKRQKEEEEEKAKGKYKIVEVL